MARLELLACKLKQWACFPDFHSTGQCGFQKLEHHPVWLDQIVKASQHQKILERNTAALSLNVFNVIVKSRIVSNAMNILKIFDSMRLETTGELDYSIGFENATFC